MSQNLQLLIRKLLTQVIHEAGLPFSHKPTHIWGQSCSPPTGCSNFHAGFTFYTQTLQGSNIFSSASWSVFNPSSVFLYPEPSLMGPVHFYSSGVISAERTKKDEDRFEVFFMAKGILWQMNPETDENFWARRAKKKKKDPFSCRY